MCSRTSLSVSLLNISIILHAALKMHSAYNVKNKNDKGNCLSCSTQLFAVTAVKLKVQPLDM